MACNLCCMGWTSPCRFCEKEEEPVDTNFVQINYNLLTEKDIKVDVVSEIMSVYETLEEFLTDCEVTLNNKLMP